MCAIQGNKSRYRVKRMCTELKELIQSYNIDFQSEIFVLIWKFDLDL